LPILPRPTTPPPFPYTTLFRSNAPTRQRAPFARSQHIAPAKPLQSARLVRGTHEAHRGADQRRRLTGYERVPPRHGEGGGRARGDRKSTRLNSSHVAISYAVFC